MATIVHVVDASSGTAALKTAVDVVSPGANRSVAIHSIGSKLIIVGYDTA